MTELDTAITAALERRTLGPDPTPPPLAVIADRHRRQSRRRALRRGGIVACCAMVAVVGVGVLAAADRSGGPGPAATRPVPAPAPPPVPNPTLEGWPIGNRNTGGEYYAFTLGDRERYLMLSYFAGDVLDQRLQPGMSAPLGTDGTPAATFEVRGTTGYVPAGYPMEDLSGPDNPMTPPGSTRVLWVEDGWTIDATGVGITSPDELRSLVEQLQPFTP